MSNDFAKFTIYYGDGSTYQGRPEHAPPRDVQCIAWNDESPSVGNCGRVVLHQWDIYIYSDGIGWHGTNKYADLLMHLGKGCGPGGVRAVLQGAWIARDKYDAIYRRAEAGKTATAPIVEDGEE